MVVPDEGFKVPYQIFLFLYLEKPQEKFVGAIASVIRLILNIMSKMIIFEYDLE